MKFNKFAIKNLIFILLFDPDLGDGEVRVFYEPNVSVNVNGVKDTR